MKKILLLVWIILLAICAFAQSGRVVKTGVQFATQSDVALKVAQKVQQTSVRGAVVPVPAQISNWSGKPIVRIQPFVTDMAASHASSTDAQQVVARVLDYKTAAQHLLPQGREGRMAYIPSSFQEQKNSAWYKGMHVTNLDGLKHVLTKGMTLDKAHHYGGVFATTEVELAQKYAVSWGSVYPGMPVLVRIPITPKLYTENKPDGGFGFIHKFRQDLSPSLISDVMVFLEVNGEAGWYKVVLQEDELVFHPVSGVTVSR